MSIARRFSPRCTAADVAGMSDVWAEREKPGQRNLRGARPVARRDPAQGLEFTGPSAAEREERHEGDPDPGAAVHDVGASVRT